MTIGFSARTRAFNRDVVSRQRRFFSKKDPGGLLVFISEHPPRDDQPPRKSIMVRVREYLEDNQGLLPNADQLDWIVSQDIAEFRRYWEWRVERIPDDTLAAVNMEFDIGVPTAVMTGLEPAFHGEHWWLEPNLGRDAIASLKVEPDNRWLDMFVHLNRALWRYWEEDYYSLPFWHRSPLDAANGIRGNALFEEMFTAPERVKRLTDWCVDCELAIERTLYDAAEGPESWGVGHANVWLPKHAVLVNGDPVALISRDMMREFEQPYTGRLFTSTGGGFFHNHTKGLHQVDQVAQTPGIILQNVNADPNCPRVSDLLMGDEGLREVFLASSLTTPIFVDSIRPDELDAFLPYLPYGRFLLQVVCTPEETDSVLATLERARGKL